MKTTAEKLTYLNTTKQNLKTVINTTGAGLTDESTFRSYANVLNDKILGAINGDVDLFEEYPKVSGNGTDLSLNGVVEGKMSITPQGGSSQDGEPTPTTPVPVKSVTGENSIVLKNANLLDKTTLLPKSTINGTTGEIEDYDGCGASEQYISVLPNTQYTFSCSTTMLALRVSCYNLEKEHIERKSSTSNVKSFSFLTPDDCHYVRCSFNYNNVIIVTQEVLNTLNLQVTKGSTAPTTYVEHEEQNYQLSLGNIELNSSPDGTIRDGIIGKPNEWYKREYIGKVVLDGSETIQYTSANNRFDFNVSNIKPGSSGNPNVISDNYTGKYSFDNYSIFSTSIGNQIAIIDNRFTNVNDFKTWLSTHNTTVWYVKAEYTDIPITDATLISQLNEIYNNAHSYNGVTNITTTYEDGNEQMYLDIEALKNVWDTSL